MAQMRENTLKGQKLSMDKDHAEGTQDLKSEKYSFKEENMNNEDMPASEEILTVKAELAQVKAKADENYDQLLRLQADFANYKKRTQHEKAEIIKYASERLIEELLPVLDNFERAAGAAPVNPEIVAYAKGIDMILRQLQTALSKEGLKAMEAVGQPFDPNFHDAVLRVESDEHPENTVVEELQKGYMLKDKVLRPCMVKVCN